jgi:hypothetical protein
VVNGSHIPVTPSAAAGRTGTRRATPRQVRADTPAALVRASKREAPFAAAERVLGLVHDVIIDGMSEPDPWDPGSPQNRERTRESWHQVRRLLMEWDLIGVAGIPEAADEYDCMISPLLHRLFEGADTRSLFDWIRQERPSHFGAGPDDVQDMQLAESLTAWWERPRTEAT